MQTKNFKKWLKDSIQRSKYCQTSFSTFAYFLLFNLTTNQNQYYSKFTKKGNNADWPYVDTQKGNNVDTFLGT